MATPNPQPSGTSDTHSVILELWRGVAERRKERRSYEWKVTLGLWAGILLLTNVIVDKNSALKLVDPTTATRLIGGVLILVAVALVTIMHFVWLFRYIGPAHQSDRLQAIDLEQHLRSDVGLPSPTPADRKGMTNRSSEFQLLVTFTLALGSGLVVMRALDII